MYGHLTDRQLSSYHTLLSKNIQNLDVVHFKRFPQIHIIISEGSHTRLGYTKNLIYPLFLCFFIPLTKIVRMPMNIKSSRYFHQAFLSKLFPHPQPPL